VQNRGFSRGGRLHEVLGRWRYTTCSPSLR
jgi:hypothetical protein